MPQVLLIDDDSLVRTLYRDVLLSEGYEVDSVPSGEEGIDRLHRGEQYDLVISDILMAKMDGWELLRQIRLDLKIPESKLPIIVVSSVDSAALEIKAFQLGASGYLTKPITPISKLTSLVKIQTGRARSQFDDTDPTK